MTAIHRTYDLMSDSEHKLPEELKLQKTNEHLPSRVEHNEQRPTELVRPVKFGTIPGELIDERTITYSRYNSFNYSLFLPEDYGSIKLSLGITSPNEGEGKTTATCNLATAISLGTGRRTLVVDLNLNSAKIHKIFGIPRGPGVTEALSGGEICVEPTQVENLFAMPAGSSQLIKPTASASFRQLVSSLFREFEFIIVDMPSVSAPNFPTLIANQLTGLVVVVRSKKTKRRDLNKLFRRVREDTVLGFVMNDVNENDL